MTAFRYYSIMRPVGIGTYPGKPTRVENYPEGKKLITTADGRKLWVWGELEYVEPLNDVDVTRYELRGECEYPEYHHRGYWMNDGAHEIIQLGKKYYVLNGWNGESYGHCWECLTKTKMVDGDAEYTLKPIYRFETEAGITMMNDMSDLDEDSDEWQLKTDYLNEIISYSVTKN